MTNHNNKQRIRLLITFIPTKEMDDRKVQEEEEEERVGVQAS